MTAILFPGRHHLLTQFQHDYLTKIISGEESPIISPENTITSQSIKPSSIIFAITSANHSNTRRNPCPLHHRAMALNDFSNFLDIDCYIYDIDDVGTLDDFASYVIKRIKVKSNNRHIVTPDNTLVLCSTPSVIAMYHQLGFSILPAELSDLKTNEFLADVPWNIVTDLAKTPEWQLSDTFNNKVHESTRKVWRTYLTGDNIYRLFHDDIIGDDGDLTETRDYNSYVRGMDEIAKNKFDETSQYIQPGRIGDIGCAVGSWIKLAQNMDKLAESDFFGVEISRQLFEICEQRKNNKEFKNPFTFFIRKNAVTNRVFDENSMNTIFTSSLTHEIKSYVSEDSTESYLATHPQSTKPQAYEAAGLEQLKSFIQFRQEELVPGGIWINRDVIGAPNSNQQILIKLNEKDGENGPIQSIQEISKENRQTYLDKQSTLTRFKQFQSDFRAHEGYQLKSKEVVIDDTLYHQISLRDACEFMTKKDYTDNWLSEMHETFCFWDFTDWQSHLEKAGFQLMPDSRVYRNDWIVENRLINKIELFSIDLEPQDYPVTHAIIIAMKY